MIATHSCSLPSSRPKHPNSSSSACRKQAIKKARPKQARSTPLHPPSFCPGNYLHRALLTAVAHLPGLHLPLERCAALVGGDVVHKGLHVRNWPNWQQVDAEDYAPSRHELGGDLAPASGGGAQVDADLCRAEEVILLVDLESSKSGAYGSRNAAWGKWGKRAGLL